MQLLSVFVIIAAALASATAPPTCRFANFFAPSMVLQRNQPLTIWGFATPGDSISLSLDAGAQVKAVTDNEGVWRVTLPPNSASDVNHTLTLVCPSGSDVTIDGVLFGIVLGCHGQSNMDVAVNYAFNATAEINDSKSRPLLRFASVAETQSTTPAQDFNLSTTWVSAAAPPNFASDWSAVCYFSGRGVYDAMGGTIPVGLFHAAVGGTPIQAWTPTNAIDLCTPTPKGNVNNSVLYNAMLAPLRLGPAVFSSLIWYQAEWNLGQDVYYECALPALITSWRAALVAPALPFTVVQLHAWNMTDLRDPLALPMMRAAQLRGGFSLPHVAVVPAYDGGDPHSPVGSIHPRGKQRPSARVARAALALAINASVRWQAPTYQASSVVVSTPPSTVAVDISFTSNSIGAGGLEIILPHSDPVNSWATYCPIDQGIPIELCAWASVCVNASGTGSAPFNGLWLNATPSIGVSGMTLRLTAAFPPNMPEGVILTPVASSLAFGTWPVVMVIDKDTGLPAFPFNFSLS